MTNLQTGLSALAFVRAWFPDAVIAGGFLRDLHFGRSPKDIDIFVPHRADAASRIELLNIVDGSALRTAEPMNGGAYMAPTEVSKVWDLSGFELPAQIIMMAEGCNMLERIASHDFDFCQVYHDGWGYHFTEAFLAMRMNEVTLVHCEDLEQYKRSMRRWKRLQEKYPDFKLVVPVRYQHFAAEQAHDAAEAAAVSRSLALELLP